MNEISGGDVSATTTSGRGSRISRQQHDQRNIAKSAARRQRALLPRPVPATRKIRMPRQVSVLGNNFSGSS